MAGIQTHFVQSNFLSGVLDPRTQGRVDTSAYVSSMLTGINIELVHLGGVQRRRGLQYCLTCPNQLTLLTGAAGTVGGTYTMPNGGTAASISTNSTLTPQTSTTPPDTTNPWVLAQINLGSPQTVLYADAVGITLASGSSIQFCIQSSPDGATWTTVGSPFAQLDSTALYTYRVNGPTTAQYWRIAKIGGANLLSEVTIAAFTLWADSGVVSNGRLFAFEVSTTEQYLLAMTDRNGTLWNVNTGAYIQNIALNYLSSELPAVDAQSSAESMMIVHENHAPHFLIRLTPTNFQSFDAIFAAIPQIDYGDSLSPTPTSDLQTLTFNNGWIVGDTFTMTLLTDTTGPITYSGDNATTATAIQTAVQALWAVNGFTGVTCTSLGSYTYTLTFAAAAAAAIGAIAITSLSSNASATATETQIGVPAQEPLWSALRGYPGTVTFFQGRMYFGGTLSQQETVLGSWVNNILNFSTAQGLDDQAIYVTMNGVALNAINGMFPGKSLCVFTTGGEFRFINDSGQTIVPTSAPQNQTQYGGAKIKPVMIDGNIIYVQRSLKSIRDFQFDYTVEQYNSLGISSLAPNLIYNVNDMASWNGSALDEINLVFVCNGVNPSTDFAALPSGACAVYNTRKEVNVQGWTTWVTGGQTFPSNQPINATTGLAATPLDSPGTFQNVAAVVQSVFFLVQRVIGGKTVMTLEQANSNYYTDCATQVTNAVPSATVIGLSHLNGQVCRVVADGFVLDNQTPVNGSVTLTSNGYNYLATNVEIGINFNPTVEPMPLQTVRWPAGSNLAHKKRIVAARIKVRNTRGLLYNGQVLQECQLDNFNFGSSRVGYSGILELEDSSNWDQTQDKTVTFSQVDPLPFYLMFMDIELSGEA
jgi:hypothetical protein